LGTIVLCQDRPQNRSVLDAQRWCHDCFPSGGCRTGDLRRHGRSRDERQCGGRGRDGDRRNRSNVVSPDGYMRSTRAPKLAIAAVGLQTPRWVSPEPISLQDRAAV